MRKRIRLEKREFPAAGAHGAPLPQICNALYGRGGASPPWERWLPAGFFGVLCLIAMTVPTYAQDTQADLKSQEDWLRYSNWEHRSNRRPSKTILPSEVDAGKMPALPGEKSGSASTSSSKVPLPENPGSQTVDGGQTTIPGWAFQQPQQAQRSPQIFVGGDTLGARPGYMGGGGLFGYPMYGGGGGGLFGHWGGRSYLGGPWQYGGGWRGGQSRLGAEVIETGPSPASGNYYQPSTGDPSASGNYYAGGAPWQVPLNTPNSPKEYWGPQGSPFKKD